MSDKSIKELLKELESINTELENEELDLEKAMQIYQKGMEISKIINQKLESAQQQINKIAEDEK